MEYTYEFLKRCDGIRFRAKWNGRPIDGMIRVFDGTVWLYYGAVNWLAHPTIGGFGKYCVIPEEDYEEFFSGDFSDFEIVPRSPETYKDWHVGDKISGRTNSKGGEVIFRCGELVICRDNDDGRAAGPFTCEELFEDEDCRLVLTDIEKQIIEEKKKAKWKPQDGDIVAWKSKEDDGDPAISIYKEKERCYATIYADGSTEYSIYVVFAMNIIRPATYDETQRLFDAMEKDGKRWNAEKKVVEDIPKPYEFRKGEPVLVRSDRTHCWQLRAISLSVYGNPPKVEVTDGCDEWIYWIDKDEVIPYNERTMHLLGTSEDYKEEQP